MDAQSQDLLVKRNVNGSIVKVQREYGPALARTGQTSLCLQV